MAGYIFALPDFLNPNPVTAAASYLSSDGTENASFPRRNVGIYNRPHVPWISNADIVSGTTYVGINLGSAKPVAAVIIDNININSIKIQAANNPSFTTPNQETVTVSPYPVERNLLKDANGQSMGRYKCCFLTAGTNLATSQQYWRVLANTSTLIDSTTGAGTKMSVGSIILARSVVTLASGTNSYGELPLEATRPNDNFDGGGSEPVILGNPYSAIILGASPGSRTALRDDLLNVMRAGIGRWFVFFRNAGNTAEFIVCRRAADVTLTTDSPTTFSFQQFALEGAC